MNIKKAFTKLAYISAGRDCDSYMSLNEMRMILESLDEPPESIGEISSRFYNENRQLKIDLDLANADIETFNKEIERLKEVITALKKMPSGLHMFQKLQDERDKLYGEISIANGLVKNLEEQNKQYLDRLHWAEVGRTFNKHFACRFCGGTGIEKPLSEIKIYGKTMKQIADILDFAEQHGYKEK